MTYYVFANDGDTVFLSNGLRLTQYVKNAMVFSSRREAYRIIADAEGVPHHIMRFHLREIDVDTRKLMTR